MSNWWKIGTNHEIPFSDSNFQKILRFYLFECPVVMEKPDKKSHVTIKNHVSARGISLERNGWSGKNLVTLLAAMKRSCSKDMKYIPVSSGGDVAEIAGNEERTSSLENPHFEIIAFTENADLGKTKSILYLIRNALAHGSFSFAMAGNRRVYYFESAKDGTVKAQLRLGEDTLLQWIELVNTPVGQLREKQGVRKKKQAREAL